MGKAKRLLKWVSLPLIFILMVAAMYSFFSKWALVFIQGDSMEPTFSSGNVKFLRRAEIEQGNIAVFTSSESWGRGASLVKRVIAAPEDELMIEEGLLTVNGQLVLDVSSTYPECSLPSTVIPDGYIFVIGDNYQSSNDSLTQLCKYNNNEYLVPIEHIKITVSEGA